MPDYNIVVRIDSSKAKKGSNEVNSALNDVGNNANRVRDLITKAFAFIGVAAGIRKLIELTDAFTNVQNRLKMVTTGSEQLSLVTQKLFDISDRTRQSFETTAELYARMGLASKDLGVSQNELLQFTESLNQAVILSGASANEASFGLLQLSQGLASGTLRGDELRSVLEQLPMVADVISKSMGITRGELRNLGMQGKITADIVFEAFKKAQVELAEKFAKTVPTIGQSFTVLRSNLVKLIGEFDKSTGFAALFAKAIMSIAANIEPISRAVAALALTIGTTFAISAVGKAITAIRTLTLVMLANPFTALGVAVIAIVSTLVAFGDQMTLVSGTAMTAFDLLSVIWTHVVDTFSAGWDIIKPLLGDFGNILANLDFSSMSKAVATAVDTVIGLFVGCYKAILAVWDKFPGAFVGYIVDALNTVLGSIDSFLMSVVVALNKLPGVAIEATFGMVPQLTNPFQTAGADLGTAVSEGFASGFTFKGAETALNGLMTEAEKKANERVAKQKAEQEALAAAEGSLDVKGKKTAPTTTTGGKTFTDKDRNALLQRELFILDEEAKKLQFLGDEQDIYNTKIQLEEKIRSALRAANKGLTEEQINNLARLTDAENSVVEAAARRNAELKRESDLMQSIKGPAIEYEENLRALNALLDKGKISTAEYNDKLLSLKIEGLANAKDMSSGVERGMLSLEQTYSDFATTAETAVTNAFKGMEDAIVTFATTGKLSFTDLIDSMFADITRLAVQQTIMQPLVSALNSIGSSSGSSTTGASSGGSNWITSSLSYLGNLIGFAEGGSFMIGGTPGVDQNVLSLNDKPVARVSRGETIAVSPNGTNGSTVMNFNISTPDANSFQRSQGQIMARAQGQLSRAQKRNS